MILSGVFNILKIPGEIISPTIVMPMLRTNCPIRAVDIVVFISRILPAPKSCDITTLQPMDKPEARATARKTTGKEAPTAARASAPTKLPTTMESTMLYNC